MENEKKKSKIVSALGYVAGSLAVGVVTTIVLIKAMPYISGALYKASVKANANADDDDDWGPVIERKTPVKETEEN